MHTPGTHIEQRMIAPDSNQSNYMLTYQILYMMIILIEIVNPTRGSVAWTARVASIAA
jgi:hypothetical protein